MTREIIALAGKDVRLLMRDKGGAFVAFVFPLIYCIFFGLIFAARTGADRELSLVVVDEDQSAHSSRFIQGLYTEGGFAVEIAPRVSAVERVRRGEKLAYVVLSSGFGDSLAGDDSSRRPGIEIGVDPGRQLEAGMIRGHLIEYVLGSWSKATPRNSGDDSFSMAGLPVEISTTHVASVRGLPQNSYDISFPQGIIWGILGCCATFVISMVVERTGGTLSRLRTAPINRATILGGKAVACFGSTVVLALVLFIVGWIFFGVIPKDVLQLAVSVIFIAIAFVGIMMFLSILGKTERSVSGVAWGVLLGMAMLGGGMVPRMFMPQWMQTLSNFSPVRWAIIAMEGAVWRDYTAAEMFLPWSILLGIGVLFFAVGVKGFEWADQR